MSQSVCVIVSVKTCETNEWQKTILRSHWEVNTIEPRKLMARKQRKPSQLYTLNSVLGNLLACDVFSFQTACWYEFKWMVITVSSNTFRPIQGCIYAYKKTYHHVVWIGKTKRNQIYSYFYYWKKKEKSAVVLWKKKCSTPRLRSE